MRAPDRDAAMNDAASHLSESVSEPAEPQAEPRDDVAPGMQPPSRMRYRPSEAWALRWLGNPSR
jgi:hypothetical protein